MTQDAAEARIAQWLEWLEVLRTEILDMHLDRKLYTELRDAIQEKAPEASGVWLVHYSRVYWQSQAMAIRRVVVGKEGSIAFTRLVRDMAANAKLVTEDRYVSLFSKEPGFETLRRKAAAQFQERWGSGAGPMSEKKLQAALNELMRDLKAVVDRADRAVAHIDERGVDGSLTFADLHAAVERVGDAWNEINILFTASEWKLTPAIADDWRRPFRAPLFKPLPTPQIDPSA